VRTLYCEARGFRPTLLDIDIDIDIDSERRRR